MDIMVKVTVPGYVYRFYEQAARHVANFTTEELMSDALSAYAGLLSDEIARKRSQDCPNDKDEP